MPFMLKTRDDARRRARLCVTAGDRYMIRYMYKKTFCSGPSDEYTCKRWVSYLKPLPSYGHLCVKCATPRATRAARRATRDPQKAHLWSTPNMFAEDRVKIRQKLAELCSGNELDTKKKKKIPNSQSYREFICKLQKSRCFAAPVLPLIIKFIVSIKLGTYDNVNLAQFPTIKNFRQPRQKFKFWNTTQFQAYGFPKNLFCIFCNMTIKIGFSITYKSVFLIDVSLVTCIHNLINRSQ